MTKEYDNCMIENKNKKKHCIKSLKLRPLMPYFGGKFKVSEKIISKFPKHDTFVEPFIGGGSVYWANTQAKKFVINDKNKEIVKVYKTAKNSPAKIKSCDFNIGKNKFNQIKKKSNKSSCDIINKYKHSFGGTGQSYAEKGKHFNNKFSPEHIEKLKKTTILNQDFKNVVKSRDRPDVLQYLDPPYVKAGKAYEVHGVTAKDVCDTVKSLKKAKAIISYDINAEVKNACKGLKFHTIGLPYSAGNEKKIKKEYLITNY